MKDYSKDVLVGKAAIELCGKPGILEFDIEIRGKNT